MDKKNNAMERNDVLPNGALILGQKHTKSGEGRIVLCQFKGEFVTWFMDDKRNTYSGNYFRKIEPAFDDFMTRV